MLKGRELLDTHDCPYLPDRTARTQYVHLPVLSGAEYEVLMNHGFRKFGALAFRPLCLGCAECRPIRIPLDRFRPDRSQRRCWKRNAHLELRVGVPEADEARLDLYNRYHLRQMETKGWKYHPRDLDSYNFSFVENPVDSLELTLWEGEELRAVVITDVTPRVISGVYHYHDPDLAHRGLGTCAMLHTLNEGRRLGKEYAYFGYYVRECPSLSYKARFRPCEILTPDGEWVEWEGEPAGDEAPPW